MAIGDEKVTIRIDVKADTAAIDRVRQKIRQLCREADNCEKTFSRYADSVNEAGEAHVDLDRNSTRTTQALRRMGRETNVLSKILKTGLKFALIGAAIESAALAIALSSVNGLLATGRFLVKGYHVVMSGLAKAAAAAGVALATVAAAQRQFVAAQATGRYGGSFAAASQGLRTLTGDARLASLGVRTLSGAFQAASKNARVTGGTASAIAGLMDFAVASGDIEKGAAAVAELVSLVQKGGVGQKGVLEAAKQLGPEFEKAFKEATRGGRATSAELMRLFSSGQLARQAGIAGGFAATQGTLVGQLKAFMTEMQVMFGDLGMQFIEPVQRAFQDIRRIMVRTVTQLMPLLADFARESLIDKMVNGIDKMSQFLVTLMQDYVPKTQGFFESMSRAWDKLTNGFERFNRYLRRFSEASKVINTFFGQIFGAIGSGLKNNFEAFAEMLVTNQSDFDKFGKSLANLITQIFNLFNAIREAFFRALPVITNLADIIARIVQSIADLLRMMTSFGGLGGLASLMLPMAAGLQFGGRGGRGGPGGAGAGRGARMGGAGKLGIMATILGVAGLSQVPGIGGGIGQLASAGLLGAMFAPAGRVGAGMAKKGFWTGLPTGAVSKGVPIALPAAVATAGIAGANMASDAAYSSGVFGMGKGNKAVSAGAGAAAGATAGAIVGSMVPVIGTALGAVGGAIIGGIIGWSKEGKFKSQARKAAGQFVEDYAKSVEGALAGNDMAAAQSAMNNFTSSARLMADQQVKSGTAYDKATELWADRSKELQASIDIMGTRFDDLSSVTGMTDTQIRDLANSMEVDLGNSMMSLKDVMEQLGIATFRGAEAFQQAAVDIFADATSRIQTELEILQAPQVVDEITNAWFDKVKAGTLAAEDTASMLQGVFQQELLLNRGDALETMQTIRQQVGYFNEAGQFVAGGQFTAPGGAFYDPSGGGVGAFLASGGAELYGAAMGDLTRGVAGMAAENIISGAAGIGKTLGVTVPQLTDLLASIDPVVLEQIARRSMDPNAIQAQFLTSQYGAMPTGAPDLMTQLSRVLMGNNDVLSKLTVGTTAEADLKSSSDSFVQSTGFFKTDVGIFKTAVADFANAITMMPGYQGPSDTMSPRRNIVNTLGAHSRFDAMIAGNRSVTSGYRNWNLGSINSDHAAGRAYDLVGQNLGLYQMAVKASGGYAEFHGGSSGRHLHVVPNVNGGIGDSVTPFVSSPSVQTSSPSNMTVNMVVNASPGMDTVSLANEVMARIESAQRSMQERY